MPRVSRQAMRRRAMDALFRPTGRNAVKFKPVVDEAEAQLFGNAPLQFLQLRVDEFDHIAGFDIDEVIVVRFRSRLIARTSVAKIMPFENAGFFEQPDRTIYGGDRNAGIDGGGPLVEKFNIGMVFGIGQNTRDHAALFGDTKPFLRAELFDIDFAVHGSPDRAMSKSAIGQA